MPCPRTTPCLCGCGEVLHQKQRGKYAPRLYWSAKCAERAREARKPPPESEAEREARNFKRRLRYAQRKTACASESTGA